MRISEWGLLEQNLSVPPSPSPHLIFPLLDGHQGWRLVVAREGEYIRGEFPFLTGPVHGCWEKNVSPMLRREDESQVERVLNIFMVISNQRHRQRERKRCCFSFILCFFPLFCDHLRFRMCILVKTFFCAVVAAENGPRLMIITA